MTTSIRTAGAAGTRGDLARASLSPLLMRGLGTGLGFALTLAVGRRLGDEGLGRYAVGIGVMMLGAAIARLGQDLELTRRFAAALATGDEKPWGETLAVLSLIARVGTLIGLAVVVVELSLDADKTVLVGGAAIPGVAVVMAVSGIARGLGRPTLAIALDATIVPAATLPIVMIAHSGSQVLAGHAVIWFSVAVAGALVVWGRSDGIRPVRPWEIVRSGAPLATLAVLNIALATTDLFVVSALRDDAEAGRYAAAARLVFVSTSLLVVANAVLQPRIAGLWALRRIEPLRALLRVSTGLLAIVAMAVACGLVMAAQPLLSLFGEGFGDAATTMRILAVGQFVTLASGPVGSVLLMTGHARRQTAATAVAVVANVVLDIVLVPEHGAVGAAFATTTALTVKNLLSARWAWAVVRSPT